MSGLKIAHDKCTECRMCYVVCREIDINAVVVSSTPLE
jgi:Pyruvate/2-oxoacid:ferredoxin oxidoreductase delta subunit